jgi:hypothetical protein
VRGEVRAPVVVGAAQCGRNEGGPEGQRRGHCKRGWATRRGVCLGVPGALGQTWTKQPKSADAGSEMRARWGRGGALFGGRVWRSTRCSHFVVPHAVGGLTATCLAAPPMQPMPPCSERSECSQHEHYEHGRLLCDSPPVQSGCALGTGRRARVGARATRIASARRRA